MTKLSDSPRDCLKLVAKRLAENKRLGLSIYLFWVGGVTTNFHLFASTLVVLVLRVSCASVYVLGGNVSLVEIKQGLELLV